MQYGFDFYKKMKKAESHLNSLKNENENDFNLKISEVLNHNEECLRQL